MGSLSLGQIKDIVAASGDVDSFLSDDRSTRFAYEAIEQGSRGTSKKRRFNCALTTMVCTSQTELEFTDQISVRTAQPKDRDAIEAWWQDFVHTVRGKEYSDRAALELENYIKAERVLVSTSSGPELTSMALRKNPTQHGEEISGVYTPTSRRGQGYATQVVSALTTYILSQKTYAYLYIDRTNPISAAIYEKIGFTKVDDFTYQDYT